MALTSDQEQRELYTSRNARQAREFVEDLLITKNQICVNQLLQVFNAGIVEIGPYLTIVAKLAAIDEIARDMKKTIARGDKILMEANQ